MVAQAEVGNNRTSHANKDEGSWNPGIKVTVEATHQQLVTLIASFSAPWIPFPSISLTTWLPRLIRGVLQDTKTAPPPGGGGRALLRVLLIHSFEPFFSLCSLYTQRS